MKKLCLLTLCLTALLLTSCATVWKAVTEASPYNIGRNATLVYLLGQKQLKENQKNAIKVAYLKFEELTMSIKVEEIDTLKPLLDKEVRELIKDDKLYDLASGLIDSAWAKLVSEHNVDKLTNSETYRIIIEFRQGIRDALKTL